MQQGEIVIYNEFDSPDFQIEVRVEDDTIWLSQAQIVSLFSSSKANVSEHIKHIYSSKELTQFSTVRKFRTIQTEGNRKVTRSIDHYNLDMIISIGYRVNSIRGTQFRIWANKILKEYLLKGYLINHRFEKIEKEVYSLNKRVDDFEFQIKTNLPPSEGIFYDGQIFDAYLFVTDIIKSATTSIVLIDNYVDQGTLLMLSKRNPDVEATIYTSNSTEQLQLDLKKFNAQYPKVEVKTFTKSHDRFLIIDNTVVYHIGASLIDLGKKWFAFSKINLEASEILAKLNVI